MVWILCEDKNKIYRLISWSHILVFINTWAIYSANELSVNDYYDTEGGCIVIVRSSLKNETNGYVTSVNINFETGNATDEIGNVWNIYTK